ncbi:glycosyltransferase [Asticcacaulis sp. DW145]|uniref:glycosyltransferase family 2 protein n=1 Tax=Asticcacaulis sp. DW145 TaxID=3095608 RepID=UPI0030922CBF|nr:glycosyltransferase [Asticcacaulis sp. DW145]
MQTVSVIIAAYNAEKTIAAAVTSALRDDAVSEVFVVDDASTDRTIEILRSMDTDSGRLKIIGLSSNAGPSNARNVALSEATGDWIAVLDADDYFLPGRLTALLSEAEDADLLADDLILEGISAKGATSERLIGIGPNDRLAISLEDFVRANLPSKNQNRRELGYLKPLMRTDFLKTHNLAYDVAVRLGEDYLLYTKALVYGAKFHLVEAKGYVYVGTPDSLSRKHGEAELSALRDADMDLLNQLPLNQSQAEVIKRHFNHIDAKLHWLIFIRNLKSKNIMQIHKCFLRSRYVSIFVLKSVFLEGYKRIFRQ